MVIFHKYLNVPLAISVPPTFYGDIPKCFIHRFTMGSSPSIRATSMATQAGNDVYITWDDHRKTIGKP